MPRLHLVTGHLTITRTDSPVLLYLGHDADKARTIQENAVATGEALIADRYIPTAPISRYGDKSRLKAREAIAAPQPEPLKPLIPVEISDGEDKITISVHTEEEAHALKTLVQWLKESANTVNALRADSEEAKAQRAQLLTEIETLQAKLKAAPLTTVNEVKEVQPTTTTETPTTPPTAPKPAKK